MTPLLIAACCVAFQLGADGSPSEYQLQGRDCVVPQCLVSLVEEIRVPAEEAGVLASVEAREGLVVELGQELARLDDRQAVFEHKQAQYQLRVAEKEAENDTKIRVAVKSNDVSKAELAQALKANNTHPDTVTQSDIRKLTLAAEQTKLAIEDAELTRELAQAVAAARNVDVEAAAYKISKRVIKSPLAGLVVEVYKHRGEWVNPGDPVVRVLRIDRLRVEALLNVRDFGPEIAGSLVTLDVAMPGGKRERFQGKLVFVHPEVEPVTGNFRVWAEVENRHLLLRPGLIATMTIHLTDAAATTARRGGSTTN